jgi:SAM-dependent methyltransferase
VIEHVANPLRALHEWLRVVKPDGILTLVVPHKHGTFDHKRPVATRSHLIEDFERDTPEDDQTHLPEILRLHDHDRSPFDGTRAEWEGWCRRNTELRSLHHHVFDTALVVEMLQHVGVQLLAVEAVWPCHIVAVARKPASPLATNEPAAGFRHRSEFSSDRIRRAA